MLLLSVFKTHAKTLVLWVLDVSQTECGVGAEADELELEDGAAGPVSCNISRGAVFAEACC